MSNNVMTNSVSRTTPKMRRGAVPLMTLRATVDCYKLEADNIRAFLRSPKTPVQFQDWLRVRAGRFRKTAYSNLAFPSALDLDVSGGVRWSDHSVRYTGVLACMIRLGIVDRVQNNMGMDFYRLAPPPEVTTTPLSGGVGVVDIGAG